LRNLHLDIRVHRLLESGSLNGQDIPAGGQGGNRVIPRSAGNRFGFHAGIGVLRHDDGVWNDRIPLIRNFPSDGAAIVLREGDNRKDATTE
jgi:hypothetical protein